MRHGETVRVHDLETQTTWELTTLGAKVNTLAVAPSSSMVATGDTFGTVRSGPISGDEPHLRLVRASSIETIAVDPRSRWIASGDADRLLRLWPIPEGVPLHTLPLEEFLDRLDDLTNYRVVADSESPDGYQL